MIRHNDEWEHLYNLLKTENETLTEAFNAKHEKLIELQAELKEERVWHPHWKAANQEIDEMRGNLRSLLADRDLWKSKCEKLIDSMEKIVRMSAFSNDNTINQFTRQAILDAKTTTGEK
jgi:hypothetical protein